MTLCLQERCVKKGVKLIPSNVRHLRDQYERGGDVDRQADDRDEIGGQPERHLRDEPAPPGLQERIHQADVGAGILVVVQLLQLRRVQQLLFVEIHRVCVCSSSGGVAVL